MSCLVGGLKKSSSSSSVSMSIILGEEEGGDGSTPPSTPPPSPVGTVNVGVANMGALFTEEDTGGGGGVEGGCGTFLLRLPPFRWLLRRGWCMVDAVSLAGLNAPPPDEALVEVEEPPPPPNSNIAAVLSSDGDGSKVGAPNPNVPPSPPPLLLLPSPREGSPPPLLAAPKTNVGAWSCWGGSSLSTLYSSSLFPNSKMGCA